MRGFASSYTKLVFSSFVFLKQEAWCSERVSPSVSALVAEQTEDYTRLIWVKISGVPPFLGDVFPSPPQSDPAGSRSHVSRLLTWLDVAGGFGAPKESLKMLSYPASPSEGLKKITQWTG